MVGPGDDGDFGTAIPTKREERPSEATVHVHPVAGVFMPSGNTAPTAGRKPKCRDPGNLPLTAMAVPAQNQVDGVIVVQHVENVGGMSQQQRKPVLGRRRNAPEVGAMERGIIHADDCELAVADRNERALVDQQGNLMPIRQLGIFG